MHASIRFALAAALLMTYPYLIEQPAWAGGGRHPAQTKPHTKVVKRLKRLTRVVIPALLATALVAPSIVPPANAEPAATPKGEQTTKASSSLSKLFPWAHVKKAKSEKATPSMEVPRPGPMMMMPAPSPWGGKYGEPRLTFRAVSLPPSPAK